MPESGLSKSIKAILLMHIENDTYSRSIEVRVISVEKCIKIINWKKVWLMKYRYIEICNCLLRRQAELMVLSSSVVVCDSGQEVHETANS